MAKRIPRQPIARTASSANKQEKVVRRVMGPINDPDKRGYFEELVRVCGGDAGPLARTFIKVAKQEVRREKWTSDFLDWLEDATGKRLSNNVAKLLRGAPEFFPEEHEDFGRRGAAAAVLHGGRISRDASAAGYRLKLALMELRDAMNAARPHVTKPKAADLESRAIVNEVRRNTMIRAYDLHSRPPMSGDGERKLFWKEVLVPGDAKVPKGLFTFDKKPKPLIAKMPGASAFALAALYTGVDLPEKSERVRRERWKKALQRVPGPGTTAS